MAFQEKQAFVFKAVAKFKAEARFADPGLAQDTDRALLAPQSFPPQAG
jgi:hypothetical protein